jgi:hypothetical protein
MGREKEKKMQKSLEKMARKFKRRGRKIGLENSYVWRLIACSCVEVEIVRRRDYVMYIILRRLDGCFTARNR